MVGVEHCPAVSSDGPQFPSEAAMAKKAAQEAPTPQNTDQYHYIMEGIRRKHKHVLLEIWQIKLKYSNRCKVDTDFKVMERYILSNELPFCLSPK